jgi:SAM-dependent methyltransferase
LQKGKRVIDFGCGCAEPLALWSEEFGITVFGIDMSGNFCDRARNKLSAKGLSNQIEIVCSPAADYIFEEGASMPQHVLGQRSPLALPTNSRKMKRQFISMDALASAKHTGLTIWYIHNTPKNR